MTLLDALYLPAAIVTAPWWARKTRSGWGERFGKIEPLPPKAANAKRILLHAVSVGEVNTLRGLVPVLTAAGCEVVVCAMTDTGLKRARELFESGSVPLPSGPVTPYPRSQGSSSGPEGSAQTTATHSTLPPVHVRRFCLDFSPAVTRFLDTIQPDLVALVELEVWPNFVRACVNRDIPIGVINGRLSARSFRGYHRFKRFFKRTFNSLTFAAVQDNDYAKRFEAMGVPRHRLTITGSMKWDAIAINGGSGASPGLSPDTLIPPTLQTQANQLAQALGIDRTKPLIVAGSTAPIEGVRVPRLYEPGSSLQTFDCEEALLHAACPEGVQLLCAPRKPEHYEKAFAALGGPTSCIRRSSPTPHSSSPHSSSPPTRFLLDTIGELRAAYALADLAIIGRTWGTLGGSDPIEPIALGKPTIQGPRYHNFESITQVFAASGAIIIAEADKLPTEIRELLHDAPRRAELAKRGLNCILSQQGATKRHADLILAFLSRANPT